MNDYVILTDSTADLTPQIIKEINVEVIPFSYTIDGNEYRNYPDEREMKFSEFYRLLRAGNPSTTAQINPTEYQKIFSNILHTGKDILYISFSSGLSGSYSSACIAKSELLESNPDSKIVIVDSKSASMGQGLLVYLAAKKKETGVTLDELAEWVASTRDNLCHWFTVDDLFHLKRGGRVSTAAAVVGSALGIKPVLHVDIDGHLIPVNKIRGRKKSLDSLVDEMRKSAINPQGQTIFISHGDALEDAEYVAKLVRDEFKIKDIRINYIGPVIGTHSGPGTIALFFVGANK